MYDAHFDRLTAWATAAERSTEIAEAKAEHFRAIGDVFEEDPLYDVWMARFLEYYMFDRAMKPGGMTPAEAFVQTQSAGMDPADRGAFLSLCRTRRSLFEIRKVREAELELLDLVADAKLKVCVKHTVGLDKGGILEARLIPFADKTWFGRALLQHPSEARKFILGKIKAARAAGTPSAAELLQLLAGMRLRLDRYRRLPVEKVYSDELRLPGEVPEVSLVNRGSKELRR